MKALQTVKGSLERKWPSRDVTEVCLIGGVHRESKGRKDESFNKVVEMVLDKNK